ncbi:MAG: BREX-2 system adenine-specific DNA-methyltransferase PglX, partial [Planctomycetota bacterium]
ELSERAKEKFALLQTPVFVEEFILDRTLTPALAEFGLEMVRMIDPTCGSGHFLLGGFARLFDLWSKPDHTTGNAEKDAQKALDGVWGVDINPFAVAIARFRLIVAAVQACGIKRLKKAPGWKIHLASGDSLLFGSKPSFGGERTPIAQQMSLFEVPAIYAVEDRKTLQQILGQCYHAVVGNPPYIIVKDKSQNKAYRECYSTCHRKYSLGVPFTQRFWELAIQKGEGAACDGGYVGMITANSFMKREFGKKLIEAFFPKNDLTHVIDTSGAYIPGHGTPTAILLGRSRKPVGTTIRAVQGIKGEPSTPEEAALGKVWQSILKQIDIAHSQDEYTSTADVLRSTFASHPWSIGGGGASDLKEQLEELPCLGEVTEAVGFMAIAGDEDVYLASGANDFTRNGIEEHCIRPLVDGQAVRDWSVNVETWCIFDYDKHLQLRQSQCLDKHFWSYRSLLVQSPYFGKTKEERGMHWRDWAIVVKDKFNSPWTIFYANVATHNHFYLEQGQNLGGSTAQVIKLLRDATLDDHIALVGMLNSAVACFWMKQVFFPKGGDHVGQEGARVRRTWWDERYQFAGTQLQKFPLCEGRSLTLSKSLDTNGRRYQSLLGNVISRTTVPNELELRQVHNEARSLRGKMIALQEELDWHCYQLYALLSDDLRYTYNDLPEISLGQRAFEIVMARQIVKGELETAWFERHNATPITEIPSSWPLAYRTLVERRIRLIETNRDIALIEKPEYKRRWSADPWEEQEQRALKSWLLDRLEIPKYRKGTKDNPELTTTAQMADVASADAEFLQVATLYRGRPDFDVAALVAELVEGEAVPFLPILRYKPAGLRKREVWERTWDLQRQQDAGKDAGEIPVPPRYVAADFLKTDFWRLRGKLDVPKERWISFPHCSTESDPTLVVGWAGWNHLEQATALIAYYDARKREGWDAKRLKPLLAGLDQLLPWIHQWHPEIDAEFGETAGQSFQTMLEHDAHELGLTMEDIRNWTPPEKVKKTPKGRKKKIEAEDDE